jgi:uncharacterized protein
VRVVLIADTHVPKRAKALPTTLWADIVAADVVIHAGDWVDVSLLDALTARATRVVGVVGNNDGLPLRARLPEVATVELAGVRVVVVHETGSAVGRERRMDDRFAEQADVVVFGHSHVPWDTTTPGGLRLLNPGSPTDRRRQPTCSYMSVTITAGQVADVQLVRLPLRGER